VLGFEHLLDENDALLHALDERKQKNALARVSALEYLLRCVERRETAGPRGKMDGKFGARVAKLCCSSLGDSDANLRKVAIETLKLLNSLEDKDTAQALAPVLSELAQSNPRAFKSVSGDTKPTPRSPSKTALPKSASPRAAPSASSPAKPSASEPKKTRPNLRSQDSSRSSKSVPKASKSSSAPTQQRQPDAPTLEPENSSVVPTLEDSLTVLENLSIPQWGAPEDDDGILSGLKSGSWKYRKGAVDSLGSFFKNHFLESNNKSISSAEFIVVVKAHTKNMKESNFNVTKSILVLIESICEVHEQLRLLLPGWICHDAAGLAVDKLADKKLKANGLDVLTALCAVRLPGEVITLLLKCIERIKTPASHEALLTWFKTFCADFGASSVGGELKSIVQWIIKETKSTNVSVRKSTPSIVGVLHSQLGPPFKALFMSIATGQLPDSSISQMEQAMEASPFNKHGTFPRKSIASSEEAAKGASSSGSPSIGIQIEKKDLVSTLPKDCITSMGSKEGKTAWKIRKQALEDVATGLKNCNGLVSCSSSSISSLAELLRGLRDRLADSQSNLKPLAARIIGDLLACLEPAAQAKLCKLAFNPLLGGALNDNKKIMREASLESIRKSTQKSEMEGGGMNVGSIEVLMGALSSHISETGSKSVGLPEVLTMMSEFLSSLPKVDEEATRFNQSVKDQFAGAVVGCLTSSKSESRSSAEKLLETGLSHKVISFANIVKGRKQLLPAQQRAVDPILAKYRESTPETTDEESAAPKPNRRRLSAPIAKAPNSSARKSRLSLGPERNMKGGTGSANRSTRGGLILEETPEEPDEIETGTANPLAPLHAPSRAKEERMGSARRDPWPEFPEEPTGPKYLGALKKEWSGILREPSTRALFPPEGIRKQEDMIAGCALVGKAIEESTDPSNNDVISQLDFVCKWIVLGLCTREDTVGMQALVLLLIKLFEHLESQDYVMSEGEASLLFPYILEKSSVAKGRFRDSFDSLVNILGSGRIFPGQKYGSVVCISVVERSSLGKARGLACHQCQQSIERYGLSAIGKRGILVTAKLLSEERSSENKAALLNLIDAVVKRMNGDLPRYIKLCGPSALSSEGRKLVEKKLGENSRSHERPASPGKRPKSPVRKTSSPPQQSNSPRKGLEDRQQKSSRSLSSRSHLRSSGITRKQIQDELPALDLRKNAGVSTRQLGHSQDSPEVAPFSFSFDSVGTRTADTKDAPSPQVKSVSRDVGVDSTKRVESVGESGSSTAASLRERLKQLKEKQRTAQTNESAVNPGSQRQVDAKRNPSAAKQGPLDRLAGVVDELVATASPLPESDSRIQSVIESMKRVHAGLSPELSDAQGDEVGPSFKDLIKQDVSLLVAKLTNVLGFSFAFGTTDSENKGICISLLSVTLATLMTVFRDEELSSLVSQSSLTLLIREATTSLLDPRLAAASVSKDQEQSANSQLVRGINKLAIHASISSTRHISLQTLMGLQVHFCRQQSEDIERTAISARSSRVITKLFARVIKAEEGNSDPFFNEGVDIESLLCAVEDLLVACHDAQTDTGVDAQEVFASATGMARTLVLAILKSRMDGDGANEVRNILDELGIDNIHSSLGSLISSCEQELNRTINQERPQSPHPVATDRTGTEVATLVAAIANASEDADRQKALVDLRKYTLTNGESALMAHLEELSAPFRRYILDLYSEQAGDTQSRAEDTDRRADNSKSLAKSMSERIKHLKSKLNATEVSVQVVPAVIDNKVDSNNNVMLEKIDSMDALRESNSFASNASSTPSTPTVKSTLSLAAKLSARREKLTKGEASLSVSSLRSRVDKDKSDNASVGSAASLRARLDAVRDRRRNGSGTGGEDNQS